MNANDRSRVLERLNIHEPVNALLRPPRSAVQQARTWAIITTQLDALPDREARRRRSLAFWACAGVVATLGVGLSASLFERTRPLATVPPTATSGPARTPPTTETLRLAGGAEFLHLRVEDAHALTSEQGQVTFADGSTIRALAAPTLVEALAMTERDVTLRLVRGTIDVSVSKGGPRKWLIEAGELSVEVVGTHFVVARTQENARVTVHEGIVLVRSKQVPDGVKRLVAGDSEEVKTGNVETGNVESNEVRMPKQPRVTTTFDALLQKADEARQAGDLHSASINLRHLLNTFPNDARSGVVAFQLALVLQQTGASPSRVVTAFENALAKARGQSLRQDCYWRLVLALENAGQPDLAKKHAAQSLRDYPSGRYAAELRERITEDSPSPSATP
jgi:FecR protein